jgi:hypothetical protein
MRSSRGLAVYKILKTKNTKTFLLFQSTAAQVQAQNARYCLIRRGCYSKGVPSVHDSCPSHTCELDAP